MKLVSFGYTEGYDYRPRIDRELLEKYKDGLIVTSACLYGEIPQHILNGNIAEAENAILWFKERFADFFTSNFCDTRPISGISKTRVSAAQHGVWRCRSHLNPEAG